MAQAWGSGFRVSGLRLRFVTFVGFWRFRVGGFGVWGLEDNAGVPGFLAFAEFQVCRVLGLRVQG